MFIYIHNNIQAAPAYGIYDMLKLVFPILGFP